VGHKRIEENKKADKKAKKVAEKTNSERRVLPAYLRKLLLINLVAVKIAYHNTLKKKWV
jgi:hypothetical protein